MKSKLRKAIWITASLIGLAGAVMAYQIGPANIWGMLRYDQRREGDLVVGQKAPDLILTQLDGETKVKLLEQAGGRPLVLIFGSFT